MAKGDSLYARLEVDFMRSFKFQKLPPGARVLYLTLWCYALEQRRQIIERPDDEFLRRLAGLKGHKVATYLDLMSKCGLTKINNRFIDMIGLEEKHSQFTWKDPPFDFNCAQMVTQEPNRTEHERNRTEPNGKKNIKKKAEILESEKFNELKSLWPKDPNRRSNWTEAIGPWNVLMKAKTDPEEILTAARHYPLIQTDSEFYKGVQSWLRKDIWRKYIEPPERKRDTRGGENYEDYK